jgi:hypothetical protein
MVNMVVKFEQGKGHELGVKKARKKRKTHLKKPKVLMKASTPFRMGESANK